MVNQKIKVMTLRLLLFASIFYVCISLLKLFGLMTTFGISRTSKIKTEMCFNCSKGDISVLQEPSNDCVKTRGTNVFAHSLAGAPRVIIMVMSWTHNFKRRQKIRNTWGSIEQQNRNKYRVVFVLGISPTENKTDSLKTEGDLYSDMLLVDRVETALNKSFLFVDALGWAVVKCAKAKFFFKVDDDVGLVVKNFNSALGQYELLESVGGKCKMELQNSVYSTMIYNPLTSAFNCDVTSYVMSMPTAHVVYNYSLHVPPYANEEIMFNYILKKLKIPLVDIPGFYEDGSIISIKRKCQCSIVSKGYQSRNNDWDSTNCDRYDKRRIYPCTDSYEPLQRILLTTCCLLFIFANVMYHCVKNQTIFTNS